MAKKRQNSKPKPIETPSVQAQLAAKIIAEAINIAHRRKCSVFDLCNYALEYEKEIQKPQQESDPNHND